MIIKNFNIYFSILCFYYKLLANKVIDINILGNERISKNTIKLFSNVNINDEIDDAKLNEILKNLYDTNFFNDVSVKIENNVLLITVNEFPVIQNIKIEGIKAKKYIEEIEKNFKLKKRGSYNEIFLADEIQTIKNILKEFGFYFVEVEPYLEKLENNKLNIINDINLGEKAKISKISFIGDKVYKDKKLRDVIISEELNFEIYLNKIFKWTNNWNGQAFVDKLFLKVITT